MATQRPYNQVAYGLSEPLVDVKQQPIIAKRNPTTDDRAQVGAEWVNTLANTAFVLTSIVDNISTWVPISSATSVLQFYTDSGDALPVAGVINVLGGTGISTSGSGNTVTITAKNEAVTYVNTTPYVVKLSDYLLDVDSSSAPITIELPDSPVEGQAFVIKDFTGSSATNNITITTVSGATNIDGATSYTMATNYLSIQVTGNSQGAYDISLGYNPGTSSGIMTLAGDTGTATGSTVNVVTGYVTGPLQQGTINFSGSGDTLSLAISDAGSNVGLGANVLKANNPFDFAGNTVVGSNAAVSLDSGNGNSFFGLSSGTSFTGQGSNVGNCAFGYLSLYQLLTGDNNTVIGSSAGGNYTGAESGNVCINSPGVLGESHTLRIGSGTGSSSNTQELDAVYISGIRLTNVGSVASVVSINSSDKLGETTITAGSGITVTPGANTITIAATAGSNIVTYQARGSGSISKGQLVQVNGWYGAGSIPIVSLANANGNLPCHGMALTALDSSTTGTIQLSGRIDGVDTSAVGQASILYASTVSGAFTDTIPIGATNDIQSIGVCLNSDASVGAILLDMDSDFVRVPNLSTNYAWVGNGSGVATEQLLSNGVVSFNASSNAFSATHGSIINWTTETSGPVSMAVNNGYFTNSGSSISLTLPATAAVGDTVRVSKFGAGNWVIAQNSGQTIHNAGASTTTGTGGSLNATTASDNASAELVCVVANTDWIVVNSIGTLTVT